MKWSVIYSFDIVHTESVKRFTPVNGDWQLTEGDEEYEYDYLGGKFRKGKHRKYVACLSDEVFRRFLENTLQPDRIEETGGMLGAPTEEGMTYGAIPAWCLSPEWINPNVVTQDAYVCPLNETDEEFEFLKNATSKEISNWIKENYI